jgi:ATP sulfurylase
MDTDSALRTPKNDLLSMLTKAFGTRELRLRPAGVRRRLEQAGHSSVVAFQTRSPLHRVHEERTKRANEPGDVDQDTARRILAHLEHSGLIGAQAERTA